MTDTVDPSTPERAAREEIDTHLAELRLTHSYRAELLDTYAAAVRARALADVAGWVEGMRVSPLDGWSWAIGHNAAIDALLAKLREAK